MSGNAIPSRPFRSVHALVRGVVAATTRPARRRPRAVAALEPLEGRPLLSFLGFADPAYVTADLAVGSSVSHPQHALDGNPFNGAFGQVNGSLTSASADLRYQPGPSKITIDLSSFMGPGAASAVVRTESKFGQSSPVYDLQISINPSGSQQFGDPVDITLNASYFNNSGDAHNTYNINYLVGSTRQTIISGSNLFTGQQHSDGKTVTFRTTVGQTFKVQMSLAATGTAGYNDADLSLDITSNDILPPPHVTDTRGRQQTVVAGHGEVFGFLQGTGAVLPLWFYNDANGAGDTQGQAQAIAVGTDAAGNDEVWAMSGDQSIWRYDQGNWLNTGGYLKSIVAGHGEVFGLTWDNALWVYNDINGWTNTGGHAASIAVGTAADGSDEVWADGGGGAIWRYDQGAWFNTGGHLDSFVAGHGQVFGLTFDNALWVYNDAVGWANTGGHAASIAIGADATGSDEVWADGGGGAIWRYDQEAWFNTGGHLDSFVAGHGEVFGLTFDNALWTYNDAAGWANTQVKAIQIALGTDALGVDELWILDPTNELLRYRN